MKPDWSAIRDHYERTDEPLRALAGRFGVSASTLFKRAAREEWKQTHSPSNSAVEANGSKAPAATSKIGSRDAAIEVPAPVASIFSAPELEANGSDQPAASTPECETGSKNGSNDSEPVEAEASLLPSASSEARTRAPLVIPADINEWDRLQASQFYLQQFNWALHPLCPPNKGADKERGKKPLLKGWKNHQAADVALEDLVECFGPDSNNNLGVVVRPPFVAVDLDSKPDKGASVMAWLAEHPDLAAVPRERTGGGAHLHFICRDVPEELLDSKKPPTAQLNEQVSAELYLNGCNLVIAPSIHKSGHRYVWEVTGTIPEVPWGLLASWFGFELPEQKKRGARWDPAKWWLRYSGDLRTLDLPGLCGELGWLGSCLDAEKGKHAVRCPWSDHHSNQNPDAEPGSDAVVFEAVPLRRLPGFKCQHAHCTERTIEHFLEGAEKAVPGIVNRRCGSMRERGRVKMAVTEMPTWLVPDGSGKPATESIRELGRIVGPHQSMFLMNSEVVRLLNPRRQPYCTKRKDDEVRDDFATQLLTPSQFITAIESYCRPSFLAKTEDGELEAFGTVLKKAQAEFTLDSAEFAGELPELRRVLRSPIPSPGDDPDELLFPAPGFNAETGVFLSMDAVRARPLPTTPENIAWARAVLGHLLAYGGGDSFAYGSPQDECHSFARFLTPFCRGLMDWNKGPVWTFEADEPGVGKDTLADLTHVQQTGAEIGYSPTTDVEEMRKAITSFLLAGGSFFHLGNVRGVFRCSPFEQASSATRTHCDRLLGQSKTLRLRNEAEYSFSANDAVFTPDILRRCRRIFQRWKGSSVNKRKFRIGGIIGWTFRNRPLLATAALTLIQAYWRWRHENPGVSGPSREFSSFPHWADIVGGLCDWAGFGNPTCDHLLDTARRDIGAPDASEDLMFLRLVHEQTRGEWLKHGELMNWAEQNAKEVLQSVIWDKEATWKRQMGRKLAKLTDKERCAFMLECRGGEHHQSRAEYRVVRRIEGSGCEEETPAYVGDWFQTPAAPCLDDRGNLAAPGSASRLSPCAEPGDAPVSVRLPVMPVILDESIPVLPVKLIQGENGANGSRGNSAAISAGNRNGLPQLQKTGITGTLLTEWPADLGERIEAARRVALDLETCGAGKGDGLNPWRGEIRLLQLRMAEEAPLLIDVRAAGEPPAEVRNALQSAEIIGHNLAFDTLWLRVKWGLQFSKVFCTLTASRLLHAGDRGVRHDLDSVLERHLQIASTGDKASMQRADWGGFLLPDMLAYASRDVLHLESLSELLQQELENAGLGQVADLEMRLLPAVVEMEAAGISINMSRLTLLHDEARQKAHDHTTKLRELLGQPGLNPSSPVQLTKALKARGIDVDSTNEDTLKAADDGTIIPAVLALRATEKLAQQADTLLTHVCSDGRIHGRFDPTGTATGRFSSKEPNLQNIGRGELRSCFIPAPGHKLIVADYSQIELRAAAAIAGETRMIEAYKRREDLHRQTAAAVLGKPAAEVTKADRQTGKAVSFGLLFGQSAPGLVRYAASSYGVTLELEQADHIRRQFFHTYGRLRQWHGESRNKAAARASEARTAMGRRRIIPSEASEWERFTALVNTPVQGSCADGMKRAIVRLHHELPLEARLVSTVHDELIIEAPENIAAVVCEQVNQVMCEAMSALFPTVPIEVEAHVCDNWGEK